MTIDDLKPKADTKTLNDEGKMLSRRRICAHRVGRETFESLKKDAEKFLGQNRTRVPAQTARMTMCMTTKKQMKK
ncbi:MAG: hypothetical protein L6V93_16455 [Clostridiales bacterium]|nr:MAG: hypothetical protein L6V93_16455 [Clostridiales bacterium]